MEIQFILSGLVRGLGLAALIVLGFAWVLRRFDGRIAKSLVLGLLFGLGGILSMHDPIQFHPGVIADSRVAILSTAALFGGVVGTFVTTALLALYRLWVGGVGATAGVAGIVAAAAIAFVIGRLPRRRMPQGVARAALVGAAASLSLASVMLLPEEVRGAISPSNMALLVVANVVGVVILENFLGREKDRLRLERVLEEEARTDPLTHLRNRRAFDRAAEQAFLDAQQNRAACSVAMLDIDRFKTINDRWGHDIGDRVLSEVAATVRGTLRLTDIVARYGGEEIIVLMPATDAADAYAVIERIRRAVERTDFSSLAEDLHVTLSAGVADTTTGAGALNEVIKSADSALYDAKRGGRNLVRLAQDSGPEALPRMNGAAAR